MRPNTPHAVFSPENAICHGGHFYATSTMQDTMFGIVHSFVGPMSLTNADKPTHGIVLRRIAGFYHDALVQQRLEDDGEPITVPQFNYLLFFYQSMILDTCRPSRISTPCSIYSRSATS